MRTLDTNETNSKTDSLQDRNQRTQKERSEQALSNLGSQDRKRAPATKPDSDPPPERGDRDR